MMPTTLISARRMLLGVAIALLALCALLVAPGAAFAADAAISGTVLEQDAPVSRVEVSAYRWDADTAEYVFEQSTETDADGAWTLEFLDDGDYTLFYDTEYSSARFALGESLGGKGAVSDDQPQFSISGGAATATPFASHSLSRLGGLVTLSVTKNGTPLTDLDNASAALRGIDWAGNASESAQFWAGEDGTITIPRVPAGGYVAWVSENAGELAPTMLDAVVVPGAELALGAAEVPAGAASTLTASGAASLSGEASVGETLTAVAPGFDPTAETLGYRWSVEQHVLDEQDSALALSADLEGKTVRGWVFAHAAGATPWVGFAELGPVTAAGTPGSTETPGPSATLISPSDGTTPGSTSSDGSLSVTGADVLPWLAAGVLVAGAGAVLLLRRRAGVRD